MGLSSELPFEAGSFSCHNTPHHGFSQPEVLRFYFPAMKSWVVWSVSLPSCSFQFTRTQMWDHWVHQLPPCFLSSPPRLPISALATSLDQYLFFNSLVVGLPYSSIFWQFWLFFVFKFDCARRQSISTYSFILARRNESEVLNIKTEIIKSANRSLDFLFYNFALQKAFSVKISTQKL